MLFEGIISENHEVVKKFCCDYKATIQKAGCNSESRVERAKQARSQAFLVLAATARDQCLGTHKSYHLHMPHTAPHLGIAVQVRCPGCNKRDCPVHMASTLRPQGAGEQ